VSYGNRDIPEPTVVVYKRLLSASGLAYSDEMALTIADRDAKCRIQLMVSMLYDVFSPLEHLVVRISRRLMRCAGVTEIRKI